MTCCTRLQHRGRSYWQLLYVIICHSLAFICLTYEKALVRLEPSGAEVLEQVYEVRNVSNYRLTMTLEGAHPDEVEVRAWIDEESLVNEHEIELTREAQTWSGLFSAEGQAFIYRVGICAPPGSCWSLSVCAAAQDGPELLFDSDMLTMAKEWLVGSCDAVLAATRASPANC